MMNIQCNDTTKFTHVFLVKKGMATKAMVNNLKNGNIKKLEKQIKKGTVKVL